MSHGDMPARPAEKVAEGRQNGDTEALKDKPLGEILNTRNTLSRIDWLSLATIIVTFPSAMYNGYRAYRKFDRGEALNTMDVVHLIWGFTTLVLAISTLIIYAHLPYWWLKHRGKRRYHLG
ncbi:hypothetical protein F5Y04DRAFT_250921 [Hypomontagnella monticulosa]|nr:hypothetical protein F5Y04DRAFT_250921 [Hypomontagnella monticulosa]